MPNLYETPERWEDYVGNEVEVKRVQRWIARAKFPSSIFITGDTGVGKTSLIQLLIKSTHCLNRREGVYDLCGECEVCRSDPRRLSYLSNVIWIDPGSVEQNEERISHQAQVREARLYATNQGPVRTGHDHRDFLFIVFDEAHRINQSSWDELLPTIESTNPLQNNVVFIFSTMSLERLEERLGATAVRAMVQRSAHIRLRPHSSESIYNYLVNRFKVDKESAGIIAEASKGSFRGALHYYQNCIDLHDVITPDIAAYVVGYVPRDLRLRLWNLLLNTRSRFPEIKKVFEYMVSCSSELTVMEQLHYDIQTCLDDDLLLFAETIFAKYFSSLSMPLYYLMQLKGKPLISSIDYEYIPDLYDKYMSIHPQG